MLRLTICPPQVRNLMSIPPPKSHEADYLFLTAAGADLTVRLNADAAARPELQMFGNRAGLLSLANILLWLVAKAWRREFLSLAELPFCRIEGGISVCLRMTDDDETGYDGFLSRTDCGEQFEWAIPEG